jgi:TatA/E family protein of Tat protein translocase
MTRIQFSLTPKFAFDLTSSEKFSIAYRFWPFDTPQPLFYDAKRAQLVRFAVAMFAAPVLLPKNRMFSIPHLIVIFVVALVVFGPEKLPELARTLGKVMAEFRRATGDLRSTFEDHLRDLERETSERASDRRIGGGTSATVLAPSAAPASDAVPETVPETVPDEAPEIDNVAEGAPDPTAALPPAPGAVTADEPYLSRASSAAPERSPKDDPQHGPAAQPESDPEKVSDGRKRPG